MFLVRIKLACLKLDYSILRKLFTIQMRLPKCQYLIVRLLSSHLSFKQLAVPCPMCGATAPAGWLTNSRWNWSEFDKFTNLSTQKLLRRRKICTMIVASCRGASAACLIGHHIHHYTKMPQPRAAAAAVAAAAATPPHVPSIWLKN